MCCYGLNCVPPKKGFLLLKELRVYPAEGNDHDDTGADGGDDSGDDGEDVMVVVMTAVMMVTMNTA